MRYVIAIGANLGDAVSVVEDALSSLPASLNGDLVARSSMYSTSPVGGPDQPDFINAVVIVETSLDPYEVLARLQGLENDAGRVRDVRWGPRTLDLDLILAADTVNSDPKLTIPHPRAHERAFVLIPWLEIDPQAEIPGHGTVRDLVARGFEDQEITPLESR